MAYENTGYLAFANALSNAGQNIGTALENRYKQQSLAALAPMLQEGKYGEAGAALMSLDPKTGIALLEKQRQTDEFNKLYPQGAASVAGGASDPAPASGDQKSSSPYALGSFGSAVSRTLGFEGGKGVDTNGAAVNFGINAAANPGVAVNDLSRPQAIQIYKKQYWDAINGDELAKTNPALAHVAFDTAVNSGPGKAKELIAQSGGDPQRLLALREDFLTNLAKSRPNEFGPDVQKAWASRIAGLRQDIGGQTTGQPVMTADSGAIANDAGSGLLSSPELKAQYNRARWTILNPNMPDSAKEAAKLDIQNIMAIAKDDRTANRPTEAMRNYNVAKQQGFGGTFMDYQAQTKGGTTVNVGPNEGEFAKKAAAKQADRFAAISEEGDTARTDLALIGQLGDLGRTIGTGGGTAAQAWLSERGIKVGPNVGQIEAYQAIVDKLTPSQRIPGSGTTSDRDMATFKSSLPSLIRTPEGNAIIERVLTGMAQSKIARADIADRVMSGEISAKDGVAEMRKLPNPFEAMKAGGKPEAAPGGTPQPQTGTTGAKPQASNLPPPPSTELEEVRSALMNAKTPQIRDAIIARFRQRGSEMRFNTDGLGF